MAKGETTQIMAKVETDQTLLTKIMAKVETDQTLLTKIMAKVETDQPRQVHLVFHYAHSAVFHQYVQIGCEDVDVTSQTVSHPRSVPEEETVFCKVAVGLNVSVNLDGQVIIAVITWLPG